MTRFRVQLEHETEDVLRTWEGDADNHDLAAEAAESDYEGFYAFEVEEI